jgi:hypothetical protein
MTWIFQRLNIISAGTDNNEFIDEKSDVCIKFNAHGNWDVNRAWAGMVPDKLSANDLNTTDDAALFTMAMGELAAWTHDLPINKCRKILRESSGFIERESFFQRIGELATTHYPRTEPNLEAQGLAQSANNCAWNAESFQFASQCSDQPHTFNCLWRYGLSLGMCIAAPLDFKAFGRWLSQQTDSAIICPSLRLVEDFYHADDNTLLGLLGSGHHFLQLIGIATANASQYVGHDVKWRRSLERSIELAEQAGISCEDVIWTAFERIQEIQRGAKSAKRQAEDRKTHAPADVDRILALESSCASLQSQLGREMEVLAKHWPLEGISEDKAKNLLALQRGQLTLALNVAEMVRPESRQSLLKMIVAEFHSQSAIFEPLNDVEPYSEPYAWREKMPQAARAFALMHERNDVGRKLGSLAQPNDQLLFPLACQPYLMHRRHNCWTHVFGKLGLLYLYALEVAYESERLAAPPGGAFLAEYAAKQALELFKHYQSDDGFSKIFCDLSRRCADYLNSDDNTKMITEQQSLIKHPTGYVLAKLFLLSSSTELFVDNYEFAMRSLRRYDSPPEDPHSVNSAANNYINVIDRLLTISTKANTRAHTQTVLDHWDRAFANWKTYLGPEWATIPHTVARALAGDLEAYCWIVHDNSFKNSTSKIYCDALFAEQTHSS